MSLPTRENQAEQPAPTTSSQSVPVVERLLVEFNLSPNVRHLLLQRRELGRARYGIELHTHNGRDALLDAQDEALDLPIYLMQAALELEQRKPRLAHGLRLLIRTCLEMLELVVETRAQSVPKKDATP